MSEPQNAKKADRDFTLYLPKKSYIEVLKFLKKTK